MDGMRKGLAEHHSQPEIMGMGGMPSTYPSPRKWACLALAVCAAVHNLEVVAQPLDGGAGHGNATLQRIDNGGLGAHLVGDRRQEPVLGEDGCLADIDHEEAPRAERVLALGIGGEELEKT
jgi:hypothetical protein